MTHHLTKKPQPIADQWMGECSCGWRTTVSVHEIPDRDATLAEIDKRHGEHLQRVGAEARASGKTLSHNPFYRVEAMPAATSQSIEDWQRDATNWEFGWRAEDLMRPDCGSS